MEAQVALLLPVTRPWALVPFIDALHESDVPRGRCIVVLDAPGCERWPIALHALGFEVEAHDTGNGEPPSGRLERRDRHRAMRRLTQTLVPDGPLLCLEDDTLVPPDVFTRLSAIGPHATGVQVTRHGTKACGVYLGSSALWKGSGVQRADACGHYCLYTTGEAYRSAVIPMEGQVDSGHTCQLPNLKVDWDCICGHLTETGVLWPAGYSPR